MNIQIIKSIVFACIFSISSHAEKHLNSHQKSIIISMCKNKSTANPHLLFNPCTIIEALEIAEINNFNTLKELVVTTQQKWLRKPGIERTEIKLNITNDLSEFIQKQEKKNNIQLEPNYNEKYDAVLILGGGSTSMKSRIELLKNAVKLGLKYKKLFMIYGYRKSTETLDKEYTKYGTEENISKILIKEVTPDLNIIFKGPNLSLLESDKIRHNTKDTIKYLIEEYGFSKNEKILIISSQPFAEYQTLVTLSIMKNQHIYAAAHKSNKDSYVRNYLDNLARVIYELNSHHNH